MGKQMIHWLVPFPSTKDISNVNLASVRLRAALFKDLPNVTFGDDVDKADVLIVGKIGANRQDLFHRWKSIIARHDKVIFDYTDDHLNNETPMTDFYKSVMKPDSMIVTSSQKLKENLSGFNNVHVIEDPYEIDIQPIKEHTSSFLWYGHETNRTYLYELIHDIYPDFNIDLTILTSQRGAQYITEESRYIKKPPNLNIKLGLWSVDNMIEVAKDCSGIFIPGNVDDPRKNGVSSNRLLTAFALGCAVYATPYNSYLEFKDYFSTDIHSFLRNHHKYLKKTKEAQSLITKYTKDKLLDKWLRLISVIVPGSH
jgi:hypothetical protein